MSFGDFKYLPRGTDSGKIVHDKVFNIAKNPKHETLLLWYIHFFIKTLLVVVLK